MQTVKICAFNTIVEPDEDRWRVHTPVLHAQRAATWPS